MAFGAEQRMLAFMGNRAIFLSHGRVAGSQMSQTIKGNAFGTFLETMNIGKATRDPRFELEETAKKALQFLAADPKASDPKTLSGRLGIDDQQLGQVLAFLGQAGMLEQTTDGSIALTSFGRDALGTFSIT
jgi:hypothetical protein